VFGYLPFLLPIFLVMRAFRQNKLDHHWLLPVAWIAIIIVLLYLPIPTQRRYLAGVQTPLAVLAAYGWNYGVLPRVKPQRRPLVTIPYVALASIALLLIISANTIAATQPYKYDAMFYSSDERRGYEWLKSHSNDDDVVLTTFDQQGRGNGGRLVAATGHRVFIGHWIETIHFDKKVEQIEQFYDPATTDTWRRDFLTQINAKYIWFDEYAHAIGEWNPDEATYLEAVFTSATVTIYRVNFKR
jgi:hypothetical protein